MTITLGWWLVPLLLTLCGFIFLFIREPRDKFDLEGALLFVGWLIGSLVVWLVYFIIF